MSSRRPLRHSLVFRTVAPMIGAGLVLMGVLAFYAGRRAEHQELRALDERVQLLANALAQSAVVPIVQGDYGELERLVHSAVQDRDLVEARIVDMRGNPIVRFRPDHADDAEVGTWRSPIRSFAGPDHGPRAPVINQGQVELVVSLGRALARAGHVQRFILEAWLVMVAVGLLGSLLLIRHVGRPLADLVEATQQVTAGNLKVRVYSPKQDEIGELADAFNSMVEDLSTYQSALVAEHEQLERRVRERTRELEQTQQTLIQSEKMNAVGQLVAGVAHELNNPLAAVLGYATMMADDPDQPDRRRKLGTIRDAATRAQRIVQNLLTFAAPQTVEREPVDLEEVIRHTVELHHYALDSAGLRPVFEFEPNVPKVHGEVHRLQQVMLNLVINAEQAMRESGRGSTIGFLVRSRGDEVVAVVYDDGPGIPDDVRSRIFEPFFTTKATNQGTGLGLSIVYGIVQDLGGTIRVDSESGCFTSFEIVLPAYTGTQAGRDEPGVVEGGEPLRSDVGDRRLLVIDDDPDVLDFLNDALEILDVEVVTALGGRAGLDHLDAGERFDLILSDMRMPEIDGRQVYEFIREHRPDLEGRLVFVTGDALNVQSTDFIEESGCEVLRKPFSVDILLERVGDHLRRAPRDQ